MVEKLLKISKLLFCFFFAALPFRVDALIYDGSRNVGSFFNPYFSHFVYLSDVFLILSLIFMGAVFFLGGKVFDKKKGDKRHLKLMGLFLATYAISLLFAFDLLNSFLHLLRAGEFFVVYYLLWRGHIDLRKVVLWLGGALFFVSLLAIYQFVFQKTLGLHFIGEPFLDPQKLGVSKLDFLGEKRLRAYGTLVHPNVLGGYLSVCGLLALGIFKKSRKLIMPVLGIFGIALAFTFSRSAWIALVFGMVFFSWTSRKRFSAKHMFGGMLLVGILVVLVQLFPIFYERMMFADFANIQERFLFLVVSLKMFAANVFGVGVGNFTGVMQGFVGHELMPWILQPVHNVYFLIANELGFIGVSMFLLVLIYSFSLLFKRAKKVNSSLFAVLVVVCTISLFDHYFFSLYQGQVLLWTVFGLIGRGD